MTEAIEHYEAQAIEEAVLRTKRRRIYPTSSVGLGLILPPEPLFENFLLSKSLTMLSAEPGTGKTWLALYMMLCLEMGWPLFGKFPVVPKNNRCLFIGMDSSPWDVAKQWTKLLRGYGVEREQIEHLSSDFVLRGGERLHLTNRDFVDWLFDWLRTTKTNVLFFDTLRAAHDGNENDSLQMEALMEIIRTIRDRFNVSVIFTHHSRKSQLGADNDDGNDSARGSSAITGAVDFHVRLQRHKRGTFLTMPKGREDFSGWDDLVYRRETTVLPTGAADRFVLERAEDTYAPVLDAIASGISGRKAIIEAVVVATGMVETKAIKFTDNGLRKLRDAKLIEPTGARGTWKLLPKATT